MTWTRPFAVSPSNHERTHFDPAAAAGLRANGNAHRKRHRISGQKYL